MKILEIKKKKEKKINEKRKKNGLKILWKLLIFFLLSYLLIDKDKKNFIEFTSLIKDYLKKNQP